MTDRKRGRLGVAEFAAATNTVVYAVTDGRDAVAQLFISNLATAAKSSIIDVAIVNGAIGALADEDYIIRGRELKLGEFIQLDDLNLAADECIVVKSSVAGVTVRVSGTEQDAANPAAQVQTLVSQALAFGAFTDVEDTTGYIDFTTGNLPAGAIVLGWKAVVSAGFTGDTTAVMQVGIAGDLDAFSADTAQSCLDAATVGSAALAAAAAASLAAVATPRVTVTGGAAFASISAGSMVVTIYYLNTVLETVAASTIEIAKITSQSLAIANFTDNTNTTGYIDFIPQLPVGAIVLGWKATVTEGFGVLDTTAVMQVGIAGAVGSFTADATKSVAAAGTVGSAALAAGAADGIAAVATPRVTVTGTADFTTIQTGAAGAMVVEIFYIPTAA